MGFRGVPSADIFLDNVTVPEDNVVIACRWFRKLMKPLILSAAAMRQWPGGKPRVRWKMCWHMCKSANNSAKSWSIFKGCNQAGGNADEGGSWRGCSIHRAAANAEDRLPSVIDSSGRQMLLNEMCREVTGAAVQLMGGYGYSKDYPMERRMRDAWGWGIAGGAIDIQKPISPPP